MIDLYKLYSQTNKSLALRGFYHILGLMKPSFYRRGNS